MGHSCSAHCPHRPHDRRLCVNTHPGLTHIRPLPFPGCVLLGELLSLSELSSFKHPMG